MLELLENLFPVLVTIIGLFYILVALLVARAIGYKGLGFSISEVNNNNIPENSKYESCNACLSNDHKNEKSNILFKHFNIEKNAKIVIWLSFILGCLFLGNQITGYLDFLTSFDLFGKIIIGGIFFAVGINARLLIKILNKIRDNCTDVCQEQFKIDLIKGFKDIKATSFVIYIFITLVTFFVLFGQKTIKKISKKK
jgi:hypothetical protein